MEKRLTYSLPEIKRLALNVLKVWKANREFRMKDTKFEDFEKVYAEFDGVLKKISTLSRELDEMRKARDKVAAKLGQLTTRARSEIQGYFGPQSSQYEQVKGRHANKAVRQAKKSATAKSELPPTPPPATPNP
jgi:uncharacterized coiled-coil DUF342 family protein